MLHQSSQGVWRSLDKPAARKGESTNSPKSSPGCQEPGRAPPSLNPVRGVNTTPLKSLGQLQRISGHLPLAGRQAPGRAPRSRSPQHARNARPSQTSD